jgi:hypothetical protein
MVTTANHSIFTPKNPHKYVGKGKIEARSSWELNFMNFLDTTGAVVAWASESIAIPYIHPLLNTMRNYYPDFYIEYLDKTGKKHAEIIEIKPAKEAGLTEAKSRYDKLALIVNIAKWKAATYLCQKRGIKFRILTEQQLFSQAGEAKRKNAIKRRTVRKTPLRLGRKK